MLVTTLHRTDQVDEVAKRRPRLTSGEKAQQEDLFRKDKPVSTAKSSHCCAELLRLLRTLRESWQSCQSEALCATGNELITLSTHEPLPLRTQSENYVLEKPEVPGKVIRYETSGETTLIANPIRPTRSPSGIKPTPLPSLMPKVSQCEGEDRQEHRRQLETLKVLHVCEDLDYGSG